MIAHYFWSIVWKWDEFENTFWGLVTFTRWIKCSTYIFSDHRVIIIVMNDFERILLNGSLPLWKMNCSKFVILMCHLKNGRKITSKWWNSTCTFIFSIFCAWKKADVIHNSNGRKSIYSSNFFYPSIYFVLLNFHEFELVRHLFTYLLDLKRWDQI